MQRKTILHLEDNDMESLLFKLQLKKSGLLDEFGIDLITVSTPKEALKYIGDKKIDLVVSDVRSDFASEKEVVNFFKVALKKSKLLFYTAAKYDTVPKLENVAYVRKLSDINVFDKIKETLTSIKKQHITKEALFKITRPTYHVATPTDKFIIKMLANFKQTGRKNHEVLQALLEFKQLRKEISEIKYMNHSQKHMDSLMDKYVSVVDKIKKYKQKDVFLLKTRQENPKEMHKIKKPMIPKRRPL